MRRVMKPVPLRPVLGTEPVQSNVDKFVQVRANSLLAEASLSVSAAELAHCSTWL